MEERWSITAWREPSINNQVEQHWESMTYITVTEKTHISDLIAVLN